MGRSGIAELFVCRMISAWSGLTSLSPGGYLNPMFLYQETVTVRFLINLIASVRHEQIERPCLCPNILCIRHSKAIPGQVGKKIHLIMIMTHNGDRGGRSSETRHDAYIEQKKKSQPSLMKLYINSMVQQTFPRQFSISLPIWPVDGERKCRARQEIIYISDSIIVCHSSDIHENL